MRRWVHRHQYRASGDRTVVGDSIWLEHPVGARGLLTRILFSRPALAVLFRYRAFATKRAIRRRRRAGSGEAVGTHGRAA